ncbi:MAG: DUF1572 family protein [Planctomycetaceae bacterium]
MDWGESLLAAALESFLSQKDLADRAIAQLSDVQLRQPLAGDANSIAIIMKHIAGNLTSRWTDFLTCDGEKPTRDRDGEFVDTFASRAELLDAWEQGWSCVASTLKSLRSSDLQARVAVRGESLAVPFAIQRSLAHISYHVGQIVLIARIHAGPAWQTLTIAPGGSRQYNREHWGPIGAPPA